MWLPLFDRQIKVNPKDNIRSTIINKLNLGLDNKYFKIYKYHPFNTNTSDSFKDYKMKDYDFIIIRKDGPLNG